MAIRSQRRVERARSTPSTKPENRVLSTELALVSSALVNEVVHARNPGYRSGALIPASVRKDLIRDAAYFRAQARGFAPGSEVSDWLAAEEEIDELIMRRYGR